MREVVQQQLEQRPAWQTLLLPAMGMGMLTLLFGECDLNVDQSLASSYNC